MSYKCHAANIDIQVKNNVEFMNTTVTKSNLIIHPIRCHVLLAFKFACEWSLFTRPFHIANSKRDNKIKDIVSMIKIDFLVFAQYRVPH